jgi:enoyl-CoA hydratase/carnithine racemase
MLPHLVGLAETSRLLYSSEIIDAREALRIGLVSEVVPDSELRARAIEVARKLGSGAPLATRLLKRQVLGSLYRNPHDVYVDNLKDWKATMATEDSKEGARAFFEKRPPVWSGR